MKALLGARMALALAGGGKPSLPPRPVTGGGASNVGSG